MWLSFRADCQNIRKTQKGIVSILTKTSKSLAFSINVEEKKILKIFSLSS